MQSSSALLVVFFGLFAISTQGQLLGLGATHQYPLGVNGSLLSLGSLLNPITATANLAVSATGEYTVQLTQNLAASTLTLGGVGSNPTLNIVAGVTLVLNGGLNLVSGTLNIAPGASLIINGLGLTVSGAVPAVINIAQGAILTVTNLNVGSTGILGASGLLNSLTPKELEERLLGLNLDATVKAALTITGAGNLNLVGAVVNIASNVVINVPITLTVSTVINTLNGATLTLNNLVTVVGNVVLNANIIIGSTASLVFSGVNAVLTVTSATLLSGATLAVNLLGSVGSVLNVLNTLNIAANVNVVVNVLGSVNSNIPIINYGSINGALNVAANAAVGLTATATSLLAIVH